jgi:hypothetical protein
MRLRHYLYRNPAALTIALLLIAAALFSPSGVAAQRGDRRDRRDQPTLAPPPPKKNVKGPRAIAVVQWQTDARGRATPKLHPVTILDDGRFYDANLYRATPVPMALEGGTVYEAQDAGEILGYFTVKGAAHVNTQASAATDDDSATDNRPWIGVGDWKTASPKLDTYSNRPQHAEVVRRGIDTINGPIVDENAPSADDRSSNKERTTTYDEQGKEQPTGADDNRPTLKRGSEGTPRVATSSSGSSKSSGSNPTDDPDRPKLKRQTTGDSGSSGQQSPSSAPSGSNTSSPSSQNGTRPNANSTASSTVPNQRQAPENDPDRPVLRHSRGGEQVKVNSADSANASTRPASSRSAASSSKTPLGSTVPQRVIDRGTSEIGEQGGVTLHTRTYEAVAVSDARVVDNPPVFRHKWQADEEAIATQKMTTLAESEVQRSLQTQGIKAAAASGNASASGTARSKSQGATPRRPAAAAQSTNQRLEGVRLSAVDATANSSEMIFSAREKLQSNRWLYVTIVARMDVNGNPHKLLSYITTSDRLDITPRLEFIDAVDADADGRGELLFRAIRDGYAEFVIFRVGPDKLEEIFHGGEA